MKTIFSLLVLTALCGTAAFAQPVVSILDSTINCGTAPAGKLVAVPSGGTAPYSYLWYDSGWGTLGSGTQYWPSAYGTYHVVVTDNVLAKDTATVVLTQVAFSATATATELFPNVHHSCDGMDGEVVIDISGGVGPFCITAEYHSWQEYGSMIGMAEAVFIDTCIAGTTFNMEELLFGGYSIVVTSHGGLGCVSSQYVHLESAPDPLLRVSGALYPNGHYVSCDTCADGTFTLSVAGRAR
jgi:hypothetical protein